MSDIRPRLPHREQRICFCREVDAGAIFDAIEAGADEVDAIALATFATTGCGTCRFDIEDILDACRATRDPSAAAVVDHEVAARDAVDHDAGGGGGATA